MIIPLVVFGKLTLATIFCDEIITLNESETVHSEEIHAYPNLRHFSVKGTLSVEGSFQASVLNASTFIVKDFMDERNSRTSIGGAGDLEVTIQISFTNRADAIFEVFIRDHLKFNLGVDGEFLFNAGRFELSGAKIDLACPGVFVNTNEVLIRSRTIGNFKFKEIHNCEIFEILAQPEDSILSFRRIYNEGIITFEGVPLLDKGPYGLGIMNQGGDIQNDGLICLAFTSLHHSAEITGTGCWGLTFGATIEIDGSQTFAATQYVVLSGSSTYINVTRFGTSNIPYNVYGFEKANYPIRSPYTITSVVYNSALGLLRVSQDDDLYLIFNIGKGYEEDRFSILDRMVVYGGADISPRLIPLSCECQFAPFGGRVLGGGDRLVEPWDTY